MYVKSLYINIYSHKMYIYMYAPFVLFLWRTLANRPSVVLASTSEGPIESSTISVILHTKSWEKNVLYEFHRPWCLSTNSRMLNLERSRESRPVATWTLLHLWFLRAQLCYQGWSSFPRFTSGWPRIHFKNPSFQESEFWVYFVTHKNVNWTCFSFWPQDFLSSIAHLLKRYFSKYNHKKGGVEGKRAVGHLWSLESSTEISVLSMPIKFPPQAPCYHHDSCTFFLWEPIPDHHGRFPQCLQPMAFNSFSRD